MLRVFPRHLLSRVALVKSLRGTKYWYQIGDDDGRGLTIRNQSRLTMRGMMFH